MHPVTAILVLDVVHALLVLFSFVVNWYTVYLSKGDQIVARDRGVNGAIEIVLAQFVRTRVIIAVIVSLQLWASWINWGRDYPTTIFGLSLFTAWLFGWLGWHVISDRERLLPYVRGESGMLHKGD